MAGLINYSVLFVLLLKYEFSHGDHEADKRVPERHTNVRVNVPNFLNLLPDFGKMFDEMEKDVFKSNPMLNAPIKAAETSTVRNLHSVRDHYRSLREFIQSTINAGTRGTNFDGILSLDIKNKGPSTKVDLNTLFGRMSLNAKSEREKDTPDSYQTEEETTSESAHPSTEVPLNEYLNNLLEEQANKINEFSMSLADPRGSPIVSVNSKNEKTAVDVSAPIVPVKVSVDSKTESVKRSGFVPKAIDLKDTDEGELKDAEVKDPEEEYLQHVEQLHKKHFQLRGFDPATMYSDSNRQSEMQRKPNAIVRMLEKSQLKAFNPLTNKYEETLSIKSADPVKQLTQYYYDLGTGKSHESASDDGDSYEEYIDDLEKVTGSLSEKSKIQLKVAFKRFRESLEKIDFGDKVDLEKLLDEPEESQACSIGRIIDQRDLEIAFLNIDKNEKPDPSDKMIVAFTLTGMPLKIYLHSEIKNPIKYLHKRLTEAGVTLNVPVTSFDHAKPVGGEVVLVGAGNRAKTFTRAMSIIVPKVDNIQKYVELFSESDYLLSSIGKEDPRKMLTSALQEVLGSEEKLDFSAILADNLKRSPNQVIEELVNFRLNSPLPTMRNNLPADIE